LARTGAPACIVKKWIKHGKLKENMKESPFGTETLRIWPQRPAAHVGGSSQDRRQVCSAAGRSKYV